MLHILLTLLKIISILILAVIGILILLILLIVFTPLKYELSGESNGDLESMKIDARFTFFIRLIAVNVQYLDQTFSWKLRIAWKNFSSDKSPATEELQNKSQGRIAKSDTESTGPHKKDITSEAKPLPDKKLKIKAENPSSDKEKTNPNQIKDKKGASVNTETESEKTLFTDKVNIFIDKIKCTLSKIYAMIESVIEKKNLVADFLSEDHHNAAFMKLLSEIKKLFKKLKPKALKGHILFGFDDPSITGKVLGCISLFYPYIEKNLTITADFENKKLVGNININGRLRISMFLAFLLNLIINKNVRITISDILSLIKKLKQGGK